MLTRLGVAVLLALALAGCGGDDERDAPAVAAPRALPDCTPMEPGVNDRFLLCRRSDPLDRGSFVFRGRGPIPIDYPYDAPSGHWSGGFLSPDGKRLLLQWTGECEVPFAFVVPVAGGTPRLAFGERRIEDARATIAHGWTRAGDAILEVLPDCTRARPDAASELWLVGRDGSKRRLR